MKTAILPDSTYCVGKIIGEKIVVGKCTLEECCLDSDLERNLKESPTPCLTTQIENGKPFFVALARTLGHQNIWTSSHIGHFESTEDEKTLVLTRLIAGDKFSPYDGDNYLIYAYQPSSPFILSDHDCCIMTSDAMITLEKDTYIGFKEGHIDSLTADELLEQLGNYEAGRSPTYKRVHLSPLTQRPAKPVEGTLISNKISDCLEYFDGNNWRKIKLEKEEG